MTLKVIAYARNGHTDKFGIPRQSREESPIVTRIVFEPEYSVPEALRGIEGYSHLWLIWGFSDVRKTDVQCTKDVQREESTKGDLSWSPTVRPPRLGGNTRMGVFATRSPFRPNPIGLSSVRLIEVRRTDVQCTKDVQRGKSTKGCGLELIVCGADLMDGTPIYDIKPYLSFSDSHPEAKNGFAEEHKEYRLEINWDALGFSLGQSSTNHLLITYYSPTNNILLSGREKAELEYILSQDPRPAYQDDPDREYKMDYAGYTVSFSVNKQTVLVKKIEKTQK